MNRKQITFGILGIGAHAKKVMSPVFRQSADATITVCASLSTNDTTLEKYFPDADKFDNYDAAISSSKCEALYIALPNALHYQWAKKALLAGKHVLCEKPLAFSASEAKELERLAKDNGCVLHEGFMYRFHPVHKKVRSLLHSGAIGEVKSLHASFCYRLEDLGNIRASAALGGGAFRDAGVYGIDACLYYLAEAPIALRVTSSKLKDHEVDAETDIELHFPNSVEAHIHCSIVAERKNSLLLTGERGSIELESAFIIPRNKRCVVKIARENGSSEALTVEPCNHYGEQLTTFCNAVRGDKDAIAKMSSGVENAAIVEEVLSEL